MNVLMFNKVTNERVELLAMIVFLLVELVDYKA